MAVTIYMPNGRFHLGEAVLDRIKISLFGKRALVGFKLWPLLVFFVALAVLVLLFCAFYRYPQKVHGIGLLLQKGHLKQMLSPVSGTMEAWLLEEGDFVKLNQDVAIIRDHEHEERTSVVKAKVDGVLGEIIAYPNTQVGRGQAIALVTSHGDPKRDLELIGFVSSLEGLKLQPGMHALVDPSVTDPYVQGHMVATVKRVGKLPMTKEAVQSVIKIPEIAKYIRQQIEAEPFVVALSLEHSATQATGYAWMGPGPTFKLDSGIIADFDVIYAEPTLLELLWPAIFHRYFGVR